MMVLSLFFILFNIFNLLFANHIKGLDDSILFRLNWSGHSDGLLGSPDYEIFEMVTTNNEKFQCLVPINYGESPDNSDVYLGQNALQLLMPLFKKNACTIRLESYWTYELCHGQHIKQYHEQREGKNIRFQEYSLGVTSLAEIEKKTKDLTEELRNNPHREIPQIKIEGVSMPYFSLKYSDGTMCDLTGTPRMTRVLYVCFEEGRHALYSIKETLTCEYEIVILTSLLCEHPSYRPQEVPQTDLHCIPMKEGTKRPKSLLHLEAESLKLRTQGAVVGDVSGGSVRLEVVGDIDENVEIMSEFEDTGGVKRAPFPLQPSIDKKLIQDFLVGDHCLQGGSGWWKYEFCHGKLVTQFHETDTSHVVIKLGTFDLEKHKQWIEEHPGRKFKPGKMTVSHFYSGGDICDNVGKPRQVEVKLICKESASPSSVALYLLEPKTCEYILGVETPLVCPLLHNADEFGLFTLEKPQIEEVIDNLEHINKEPKVGQVIKIIEEIITVQQVPDHRKDKDYKFSDLIEEHEFSETGVPEKQTVRIKVPEKETLGAKTHEKETLDSKVIEKRISEKLKDKSSTDDENSDRNE